MPAPTDGLALFSIPLAAAVALLLIAGCGGGDSNGSGETAESSVVSPPELQEGTIEAPTESADPPGGLVLPPGGVAPEGDAESRPPEGGIEMPEGADVPPAESGAANRPTIRYGTWEEIEQLVTSTGQITVVDLWSLSCEPCLKEFPGLVRLHKTYGETVRCVAVDLDFDGRKTRPPEHYEQRVADFVQSVGADFTTFISRTPSDEVYAATDLDSIPAVLIYDADGKIVRVFVDAGDTIGFTYDEDVIPLVAKLAG